MSASALAGDGRSPWQQNMYTAVSALCQLSLEMYILHKVVKEDRDLGDNCLKGSFCQQHSLVARNTLNGGTVIELVHTLTNCQ